MKLNTERILALVLVIIIVLSLILPKRFFWNPIKGVFVTIASPIQKVIYKSATSVYNFFSVATNISKLAKENNNLKEEKDKLLADKANLIEVEKENEILREQLGFAKKNSFKLVLGEVIAKDPTDIQNSLTIDVGEKAGIKEDMPVISSGMLVGKISEVHLTSSKVLLITNPNSIINTMLQESRAYGLVRGELGYGLVMESIPQETKINISDLVVTSGLGGNFPKGLLIGEVSEIISKQGEIFQSVLLRPVLDFSRLELVFVITGVQ